MLPHLFFIYRLSPPRVFPLANSAVQILNISPIFYISVKSMAYSDEYCITAVTLSYLAFSFTALSFLLFSYAIGWDHAFLPSIEFPIYVFFWLVYIFLHLSEFLYFILFLVVFPYLFFISSLPLIQHLLTFQISSSSSLPWYFLFFFLLLSLLALILPFI